jgi:hypothetical protein
MRLLSASGRSSESPVSRMQPEWVDVPEDGVIEQIERLGAELKGARFLQLKVSPSDVDTPACSVRSTLLAIAAARAL